MSETLTAARARAYLLGALDERERDAVEEAYVAGAEALDTMDAAEESLIEDYLASRLSSDERGRFEGHYLAAPRHRTRVELVGRLERAGRHRRPALGRAWLPLAAGLIMAAGATVWVSQHARRGGDTGTSAPAVASVAPPAVFAFALAPVTVRGESATDNPVLVVPPATGAVALQLQGDGAAPPVVRGRVVLRTVAGADVWAGPVAASAALPREVIAVVEIPAAALRPDDYTVVLFEAGASGVDTERSRYFLRVRAK